MKSKILLVSLIFALFFSACTGGDVSDVTADLSESASQTVSETEDNSSEITDPVSDTSEEISSDIPSEESKEVSNQVSLPEYEASAPDVPDVSEVSVDTDTQECRVTVKYTTLCEKPYAVAVGQCDIGATVTLTCGSETYTSESWYGWYSVRFLCMSDKADITVTQAVDGKTIGTPLETTVRPVYRSTPENVVAGDNFQFFYAKCLNDFQNKNLYSAGVLSNLKSRVSSRLNVLKNKSPETEIIYLIIPSAMTTYSELVPEQYAKGQGESRLDQVMQTLSSAGATVINVKDLFEQSKDGEYPLFFKCDSHWSDYGAFVAYQALFEHISEEFPDAAPRGFDEFEWHGGYYKTGDMPVYLNMINTSVYESGSIGSADVLEYGWYRTFASGTQVSEKITKVPRYRADCQMVYTTNVTRANTIRTYRDNLPSCMVIRDSFSTQMYDILAERMNETVYKPMWDYTYYAGEIIEDKPDYVIYIAAEWNLDSIVYN